ncbi:MAG TPA: glycosyltransferase [Thermoanaerobaculia bacterium]|nr:glycosyltransferase [Thermoanaerobaculia bacterium]
MNAAEACILALYYLVLGMLAVYSLHRLHLVRLRRRATRPMRVTADVAPPLTVQLPLYNEANVAARLIDAVAAIDYRGAYDIQVLDDSTDATTSIVAERIAHHAASGVRITHIRRGSREGYKAGALAHGMRLSDAELFAVFDADFVPASDVLAKMVPYLADARVGMVQARWTHLNRDESLLTRVQALFLDAHFAVESAARNLGGRFFNFNGTAGVWRRRAIEEAGGWSSSTLTEDLDLSYRAQLAGWEFVFVNDVEVPAELPAALSGFQDQQHRWAKGSIQTARKLLGEIVRSGHTREVKREAVFHLTNNSAYLLSVILAMLIVPALLVRYRHGILWTFAIDFALFAASSGSVLLFYREGQRWAGRPAPRWRELLAVLPVGVGMSVRNAVAVVEGAFERGGEFKRTPKTGSSGVRRPGARAKSSGRVRTEALLESLLAMFFLGAMIAFAFEGHYGALPFLSLFVSGYGFFAALSFRTSTT